MNQPLNLSRQITAYSQIEAMTKSELLAQRAAHESEIQRVAGYIEASGQSPERIESARRARRVLKMHKGWIDAEIRRREMEKQREEKRAERALREAIANANREACAELQAKAHADRLERIRLANEETKRQFILFKEMVREQLGAEAYQLLWDRVRALDAARSA